MDVEHIAKILTWVTNFIFLGAIIPQIFLNYRLRSAKGLSGLMLAFYFVAYISETCYAFCLHLPTAYRAILPISIFAVLILLYQKVHFSNAGVSRVAMLGFFVTLALAIGLIPYASRHIRKMGYITGWLCFTMWSVYQIPQIIKIYKEKTVKGISVMFVFIIFMGGVLETGSAFVLGLPKPSLFNAIYTAFIHGVLLLQFFIYRGAK